MVYVNPFRQREHTAKITIYIFKMMTSLTSSAMTGKNMIIVAVLLANSVKHATKPVINITAAAGGTSARG